MSPNEPSAVSRQPSGARDEGRGADRRPSSLSPQSSVLSAPPEAGEALVRRLQWTVLRPLAARCQLGLGRLCARAGRSSEAGERLIQAAKTLAELEMPHWHSLARAELRRLEQS